MGEFDQPSEQIKEILYSQKDGHALNCFEYASQELFGDEDIIGPLPTENTLGDFFTQVDKVDDANAVGVKDRGGFFHFGIITKDGEGKPSVRQVRNAME